MVNLPVVENHAETQNIFIVNNQHNKHWQYPKRAKKFRYINKLLLRFPYMYMKIPDVVSVIVTDAMKTKYPSYPMYYIHVLYMELFLRQKKLTSQSCQRVVFHFRLLTCTCTCRSLAYTTDSTKV